MAAGDRFADEAAEVKATLESIGLTAMIDVHTHFMPQQVLTKVWGQFDQAGPLIGRPWPITYRLTESDRLAALRAFGVRWFSSLNYPHKPGMAAWLNEWSAQFAASAPDCLRSATFYPEPDAAEYVAAAIADGARIFKAHVQVGEYSPNDPLLDGVWATLQKTGTPVVLHSGDGPVPGAHTGSAGTARLLERFPDLTLLIAHMGLPEYGGFLDLAERYAHVYLDTTMAFTAFTESVDPCPRDLLPRLAAAQQKVVFGSDFPNIPYRYVDAVRSITDLGLGPEWARAVLHDNAARLFGL